DHERRAGARVGRDLVDLGVLRDLLLDLAHGELLDLLGARAGPGDHHRGGADRDVGVLALRHGQVAVDAPDEREDQHHPGHVAGLGEEPRRVVGGADDVLVLASVRPHSLPSPGITRPRSPPPRGPPPPTTPLPPGPPPPSTDPRLPEMCPSRTSRACTMASSPWPSATNTA